MLVTAKQITAQCPQIYNYLGNLVTKPYFIDCQGTGVYNMNVSSNVGWGAYTINWGDGTPNYIGGTYTANSLINHVYNSVIPDTFQITLITSAPNCTITGIAVMEKPVNASIQIPIGGVTTVCAPHALLFTNSSTDVSQTTVFTWNFGDGSPAQTFNYTNAGQTVSHNYLQGTVNCQTAVTLTAKNYCTTIPTIANFNPIQIYDIDNANITPSAFVKCWPDNVFTFTNSTNRNCVPQGNTFQRQERWHFGNYWGLGHDSIVGWKPWPPSSPTTITYPAIGSYNVILEDSNLCGVNTKTITVTIVNPPVAGVIAPGIPLCQGSAITFTNTSPTGYSYKWNFGDGGGFVTKPFGPQSHTYGIAGTYTVALVALVSGAGSACTDTARVVINILPIPVANFSVSPNKGCNKITGAVFTDLSTSAIAWNWSFGNGNTFNGLLPPPQNYTTTGNFVASLTVTAANTCVNSFTAPITVYTKPIAAFSPTSACVAAIASFTDNSTTGIGDPVISWNWNFGDASATATSSVQNPTHTFTTQNTYTVQLIVNTANCTDTVLQNIIINIKPTADFTLTPLNGCPTLSVNFTNTSINAVSYNWNLGNGATSTLTNTAQVYTNTLTTSKIYTVTLTVQSSLGCSDTKTNTVTVFPKPTASYTLNASLGCSPTVVTFTNNSIGATVSHWAFGDATSSTSTLSVLSHTYINSTLLLQTFTVQLAVTSNSGCTDTTTQSVTIYPKPIFNFTMVPNSGCSPLSVNFTPVLGVVSYTWDYGDGSPLSNAANPTHTYTNITTSNITYTAQLIASNAFSCVDTTYGYPVVYAKPQADFLLTPTVGCSPSVVSYTNTSISASTYIWKFGDGATATTTNSNHMYTNLSNTINQTYTCTLVAISPHGCLDSINKTLLVYYKPNASFVLDTPKCVSKTITFTNTTLGITSSSWDFGDFSSISSLTNPAHTYANLTSGNLTFTAQLIVASVNGCKDTTFGYPVIYAKPVVNVVVTPTISCSPLNVGMSNSSLYATSYLWKFGDGSTSNASNTFHTYSNSSHVSNQSYSCTLIAINSNGCKDSIIQPIMVFYNPKADFTVDTPSCSPKTLTFINTSLGAVNYNWDFGTRTSVNINESQQYINSTSSNITYTVQLIVASTNNCKDTIIVPVVAHPKPDFLITAVPDSGCAPLSVKFPLISGVASYQWNFGDNNISSSGDVTNIYYNYSLTDKTFTVQLIGIDAYGCRDTSTKTIKVFAKPIAVFQANPNSVFVPIDPVSCLNLSTGATNYSWNFGDNTSSTEFSPSHLYLNAGEYQIELIAINAKGCKDTFRLPSKIIAILESDVDVPNAFSPNPAGGNGGTYGVNDINNDVFHPVIRGIDKYELNIFSRWGELLFVSKDINIGWDGYYKGKLCTQDVYVWKIIATTIDSKKINKTGDLLLLR